MKKRLMLATIVWVLALAACSSPPPKMDPLNRRELLAFAGFTLKFAVTQEDLDQISGIPQRELLRVAASHPPLYIWVDAAGCRCYYVGNEASFRRLEEAGWETGRK
jgi:hypothetical protein